MRRFKFQNFITPQVFGVERQSWARKKGLGKRNNIHINLKGYLNTNWANWAIKPISIVSKLLNELERWFWSDMKRMGRHLFNLVQFDITWPHNWVNWPIKPISDVSKLLGKLESWFWWQMKGMGYWRVNTAHIWHDLFPLVTKCYPLHSGAPEHAAA